jgi:peptide/nickel transport system permease protein
MNKYTYSYKLAWTLVIILLLTAMLGGFIKPHPINPAHKIGLIANPDPRGLSMIKPPFAPNATFWLGTDHRGYDMLSLILNGMKYTLGFALFITFARFLLALPVGLWVGAAGKGRQALSTLQWISSSVPPILFIFPPLMGMYAGLGLDRGLPMSDPRQIWFSLTFLIMLIGIGIFPLAHLVSERARFYNDKLYVTSSQVMGGSLRHRIRRHLLPNMRAELLFAFLAEYVQILFLMGQLAVLGIFLGGGETLTWDDGYVISITTTGEWTSLIAYGGNTKMIRLYPWVIVSAGAFYTASILILQFFLSQLKKKQRTSLK